MVTRRTVLGLAMAAVVAGVAGLAAPAARAAEPIRIGEINSYSRLPAFTEPYRNGWQLAVEQINAAGGVKGRPLEVISRDDNGTPADALTAANELVMREGVDLIAGTFFSHIGLAVSDYAAQRGVFFMASEPLTDALVWEQGNRFTFRLRPPVYAQTAMLAEEAARLPAKRWAVVAPNYEYGQSAVADFKARMKELRPDVEWVEEQWPPNFKIDAGAVVQALLRAEPEAIFNVTFGPDLAKFVREGELRGLFEGRQVVSLLTGEPEYLDPLGAEAPEGWIVTGYPNAQIDTPEHVAFRDAYQKRFGELPKVGSVVGYGMIQAIAATLERAKSTDTDALIAAAEGATFTSPFGPVELRAVDHQSTLGAYVGRTAVKDGVPTMVDWRYADGADYLPSPEKAKALRKAD